MKPAAFPKPLLNWYDKHGRDLPWRKTHDPYEILVSEIMLQQTQVSRVIVKWKAWLAKFPTAEALAQAPTRALLLAWQGMGYNNRALRLQKACKEVRRNGWPKQAKALEDLPGIGKYTAHAIACFAFKQRVPIVDVNVKRVFSPFIGQTTEKVAWEFARKLLPEKRYYDHNQALFDLGTVIRSGDLKSLPKQFQELYKNVKPKPKKRTKERLYNGHPMRLYRGAVVQLLRETKGHKATLGECRDYLEQKLAQQSIPFVRAVAKKLEKDRVVQLKKEVVTFL